MIKMLEQKYSVKKIISHDYITLASLICFVITAVLLAEMYFLGYFVSKRLLELVYVPVEDRFVYYCIFGGFACVGLACFIFRMSIIKSYFISGTNIKGTITGLTYWRDRGRITFKYTFEGQEYHRKIMIHTTSETSNLGKDDEVNVLVKPANHSKAIIMDIFSE
jgi:hypothetical protein